MSAPRELMHSDDTVILTVDVEDSPIAEMRLAEIYQTSTLNDDYLLIFKDYITLQLENTYGLGDQSRSRLLDARLCTLHCRANGDILSLRKLGLERLIRQSLQNRLDDCSPVTVSILIRFKVPGFYVSPRINESLLISKKICGSAIGWISSSSVDNTRQHLIAIGTAKDDHDKKSDIGPLSTTVLLHDLHDNDFATVDTRCIRTGTENGSRACNLAVDVMSDTKSNMPEGYETQHECDTTPDCEDPTTVPSSRIAVVTLQTLSFQPQQEPFRCFGLSAPVIVHCFAVLLKGVLYEHADDPILNMICSSTANKASTSAKITTDGFAARIADYWQDTEKETLDGGETSLKAPSGVTFDRLTFDTTQHTTVSNVCPGFVECVVVTSEASTVIYMGTLPRHVIALVLRWADVCCLKAIEDSDQLLPSTKMRFHPIDRGRLRTCAG